MKYYQVSGDGRFCVFNFTSYIKTEIIFVFAKRYISRSTGNNIRDQIYTLMDVYFSHGIFKKKHNDKFDLFD